MKAKHILAFSAALLLVAMIVYSLIPVHRSVGSKTGSYYIDADFERVRKIMVRTNSLEKIVSQQHGQVLDQKWSDLSLHAQNLRSWNIDGRGAFVVKTIDPVEGELILYFTHEVAIRKDSLSSAASLVQPVSHLQSFVTTIRMTPEDNRTRVDSSVSLRYDRKVPSQYRRYMDAKVQEAAERNWLKGQEATIALVDQYRNSNIILPQIPLKR